MAHRRCLNAALAALCLTFSAAHGAVSPQEAALLGRDLTPMGAEKAGNEAGTIPAWEGGITRPPAGWKKGEHYADPFAGESPLFVITAENVRDYADRLTVGQKALFEAYPDTYKMKVYPTHRTAAYPPRIYEATAKVATTAKLVEGGNGVEDAVIGVPFPIPQNGLEAIWNHILRYRADSVRRTIAQAAPTRGGDYTLVKFNDASLFWYHQPGMTEERLNNIIAFFKQKVVAPPRLAGNILLVHETLDQNREHRKAWVYNPGQRRVRRAPNVAFDTPGTASDGQRTSDQFDMFNGSPERYDWELVGKKEIFVPYNSYRLQDPSVKFSDILTPRHINQDLARYELHRVWVVEATLKPGARHIYKRRTFYIDEDSWQVLAVDQYDNRDQLWRVSEAHVINYYDVPNLWTVLEVHTDLQSGRYLAMGMFSEYEPHRFNVPMSQKEFTPAALRREGRR
jgi:hypothetical protein